MNGLQVGGGGGSTTSFSITADADVTLTGYGTNEAGGFSLGFPTFDLSLGAATLLDDQNLRDPASTNIFNTAGENDIVVSGLSLDLDVGETFIIDINGIGAGVQSFFTSFEFEAQSTGGPIDPVPVPAGLPLMLAGLGALAWMRRKT